MVRMLWGVLLAIAIAPSSASAFSAATMFSEPGDYIGGGVERVYHSGNATLAISGTAASLSVRVSGGNRGDSFNMNFAAPPGETLEAGGIYVGAQRASFREDGRPGIDISGDGRGCNEIEGNFEVTDLATSTTGAVTRFGAVYEQHCEGGGPALFGEVRYGYAAPAGPAAIPTVMRWPNTEVGDASSVQPVRLLAWNEPVQVSQVAFAGAAAGAFSVRSDECTGKTLEPGQSCQVFVRFDAAVAGTRRAALHFTHAGGVAEVNLDAHARGGRTRFVMNSESGDWIGGGRSYEYTPANATLSAGGSRRSVHIAVDGDDGSWWYADFEAGQGDILAPGRTYANATRYPFNNDGNGMNVSGSGRGCNTLTGSFAVDEARFDENSELLSLSLTYEQHCEGGTPALRGTIEWRAGDTTPPPPWLSPGTEGGTWTPPPDTDAAPGAPLYDEATVPTMSVTRQATVTRQAREETAGTTRLRAAPAACGARGMAARPGPRGTRRADRIRATRRSERLLGGPGDDRVWARGGDDCVQGGTGSDRLYGGAGSDVLLGGAGDDLLAGGPGRDLLVCGRGRDVARVGRGDRTRGCEKVIRA